MNDVFVLLGVSPVILVIHFAFGNYIAKQAGSRGYSYWEWVITCFFTSSLVFAVFLALLPDRSLERRRNEKKKLLQAKMRMRRKVPVQLEIRGANINTSLGDMATMDPEKLGQNGNAFDRSIGDQATCMPVQDRSLGDADTYMPTHETSHEPRVDQSLGDQATRMPDKNSS